MQPENPTGTPPEPPDPTGTPPEPPESTGTPPADLAAELERWKSNSRKHEERAKANAAAAQKLREIEDANKSESERLNARAAEAEQRAIAAERQLLQAKVGTEAGIPARLWPRLNGDDEAAMAADAKEIAALLKPAEPPKPTPPSGDVGAGAPGAGATTDLGDLSMEEFRKLRAKQRA